MLSPNRKVFVRVIIALTVCAIVASYVGYVRLQKLREHTSILANDESDFMRQFYAAIHTYAGLHEGELPKEIPVVKVLKIIPLATQLGNKDDSALLKAYLRDADSPTLVGSNYAPPSYFKEIESNPQIRVKWNAAINTTRQCEGGRYIICWLDDPRRKYYVSAVMCDGKTCWPEIVPKQDVAELAGIDAVLR